MPPDDDPPVGPEGPSVRVEARAEGAAQQAVLGQGVQHNYFYAAPAAVIGLRATTLVPPPRGMTGRADERARLLRMAEEARAEGLPAAICTIHGMGGVGKTALARALAAEVAGHFPDAALEVDLCGFTPGKPPRETAEVLGELLGLVGFGAGEVPGGPEGRSQLWRSWLAGHGALLVLDNARDAAQVRPILPGTGETGRCLVLVTSRQRLPDLDAALAVGVETMPVADAVSLMVRAAPESAGLDPRRPELAELARLCGCLPLALRSVGHLLGDVDVGDLADLMRSSRRPLEHLADADSAAAAAFTVSYEALSLDLQTILRACSRHPGPDFDAASVAALAGRGVGVVAVQLAQLLRANLLTGLPGRRYTFLDLFLGYTRATAETAGDDEAVGALRRLCADLETRLTAATALVYVDNQNVRPPPEGSRAPFPDRDRAVAWLRDAAGELATCAGLDLHENTTEARSFVSSLAYWLHAEGRSDAALQLYAGLVDAARAAGEPAVEAVALEGLGLVAWTRGEHPRAEESFRAAITLSDTAVDPRGRAAGLKGLGDVLRARGDLPGAAEAFRQAETVYAGIGNVRGRVDTLNGQADSLLSRNETGPAAMMFEKARELARSAGYHSGEADALCGLGDVALARADAMIARDAFRTAHDTYAAIGNRHGLAYALKGLGDAGLLALGDGAGEAAQRASDTADAYTSALTIYEQIGFAHYQVQILTGLARLAEAQGHPDVAEAYRQRAAGTGSAPIR